MKYNRPRSGFEPVARSLFPMTIIIPLRTSSNKDEICMFEMTF